ncbi:MAG: tryptophan 7-halogenase [Colwelliaceae bacterium]|nr:tryptophan 7-halogenase [Colwelliaceae bacterium]
MNKLNRIVVCGNGLAANLTALALQQTLSEKIIIELIRVGNQNSTDIFYGSITAPNIYDFHLNLNVSEPELLLNTNTSFCYGNQYLKWGMSDRSWLQCFHLYLGAEEGVDFHQYISRQGISEQKQANLEHYLINAQAGLAGKFAHPPAGNDQHPLSRAEYGYQFNPKEWSDIYASMLDENRINIIDSDIEDIQIDKGEITSLKLTNGALIQASLFIDCTGPNAQLLSQLGSKPGEGRKLRAVKGFQPAVQMGPAFRRIKSFPYGWQSETHLRNGAERLTIYTDKNKAAAIKNHGLPVIEQCRVKTGHREHAWLGNCVTIGHAANVIEPLTPAPNMMLINDILRLLELLPHTTSMSEEAEEYNRRFKQDAENIDLFLGALFSFDDKLKDSYWSDTAYITKSDKLKRKLNQFEYRGRIAMYDLEPFNEQDWTILHFGMARTPQIYDVLVDQIASSDMTVKLNKMREVLQQVASQMPPHALYMEKLLQYLKKKH